MEVAVVAKGQSRWISILKLRLDNSDFSEQVLRDNIKCDFFIGTHYFIICGPSKQEELTLFNAFKQEME